MLHITLDRDFHRRVQSATICIDVEKNIRGIYVSVWPRRIWLRWAPSLRALRIGGWTVFEFVRGGYSSRHNDLKVGPFSFRWPR